MVFAERVLPMATVDAVAIQDGNDTIICYAEHLTEAQHDMLREHLVIALGRCCGCCSRAITIPRGQADSMAKTKFIDREDVLLPYPRGPVDHAYCSVQDLPELPTTAITDSSPSSPQYVAPCCCATNPATSCCSPEDSCCAPRTSRQKKPSRSPHCA